MVSLWGMNKPKSPGELCRSTRGLLQKVLAEKKVPPQVDEELTRNLEEMKAILQGTREKQTTPQQVYQLISHFIDEDLFHIFAMSLQHLDFDHRKLIQAVECLGIRFHAPGSPGEDEQLPMIKHIFNERSESLILLVDNLKQSHCALQTAEVLKEAIKNDSLCAIILYHEPGAHNRTLSNIDPNATSSGEGCFWKIFEHINNNTFEASHAAFDTFRALLTTHKGLVSHFLKVNHGKFLEKYSKMLIDSPSYITKRQSLKLLSDIITDRPYYDLMQFYIKNPENLKRAMINLRDQRRMIAYEAFHLFKIFVADPDRASLVTKILIMNKEKLLIFLENFCKEKEGQECQFNDEKWFCYTKIKGLPNAVPTPTSQINTHQGQSAASAAVARAEESLTTAPGPGLGAA